ncbi:hypothetical protein [Gordonia insulae]|nr:hypothetical protein [Gordonia insulae]
MEQRIGRFAERITPRRRGDVIDTYRNIRLGMVSLIAMLAFAVFGDSIASHDIRFSISDYYDSSARAVFIATLCAMGAMLMAYKGRTEIEDVLLNFAGFLAFLVAFIPTNTPDRQPDPPLDWIVKNAWTAVFGGLFAMTVWALLSGAGRFATPPRPTLAGLVVRVLALAPVVVVVAQVTWFDTATRVSPHGVAAVSMFVMLTGVVVLNGLVVMAGDVPVKYARWYFGTALVMLVTIVVAIVATLSGWGAGVNLIFWVEWVLLAAFGAFWIVQTFERWDEEKQLGEFEKVAAPGPPSGEQTGR